MSSSDGELSFAENYSLYFDEVESSLLAPLGALIPTKDLTTHTTAIAEAARRMALAAAGELSRRQPLSVHWNEGRLDVIDGNATLGAAIASGWRRIPITVVSATTRPG